MIYDAIIIGGGPAGMMAGIRAGERGRNTLLLERNNGLGRKLLITGGGRCNITNIHDYAYFLEKFSYKGAFLRNTFAQYFNTDLINFFCDAGLKFKEEGDGCIFPETDKAKDILSILKSKLAENNVNVILGERVKDVIIKNNEILGVVTDKENEYFSPHLLIASGGLSYSKTGSTGDGYEFAKKVKHRIVPLEPALVPIEIKEGFIKDWQGISLNNICVSALKKDKNVIEAHGDLMFTHFGLSGPVILDISAEIDCGQCPGRARRRFRSTHPSRHNFETGEWRSERSSLDDITKRNEEAVISINFQPGLNHSQLNDLILKELKKSPNRQIKHLLSNIIPKNMAEQLLKYCNVQADKKSHQLTTEERKHLINKLLDFRLTVKGIRPVAEAMVTRGGICTDEINPKTMESKLSKGLFFAGEIIDIDAKTGGYNLQAAFSTGWVAGNNI